MAGPGDETTRPATTPDGDSGLPTPRVQPSMSDQQIKAELTRVYLLIGDYAAALFANDNRFPTKDLASFKQELKEVWYTDDPSFAPRYERLQAEVIDKVAPKLFAYTGSDDRHKVAKSTGPQPTAQNKAQAGDPVQLFDGDFRYSTVDLQLNGAGIDFVFARSYSQLTDYAGPMGQKWDHSFNLWLRIDPDGSTLHRSTGALAEETLTKHDSFGYWVPPDGVHGIVVEEHGALVFRRADGSRITYQQQAGVEDGVLVATSIADRFGNALALEYADGLLVAVRVNNPDRLVGFLYDDQRRVVALRDFTGRVWRYYYDAESDLVAAAQPVAAERPRTSFTQYEYLSRALSPPGFAHHLTTILDADGRPYLDNVYGTDVGLLSYRRVVAQRQGSGEAHFDYADVVEDFTAPYGEHERPCYQTVVTERDGQQTRHLFNRSGNMVMQEEVGRVGGLPKLLTRHYRYNRDGAMVGAMSALGRLTQGLHGRDAYERRFSVPDDLLPQHDPNLTPQRRLQFGNLLAVVKRGRTHDIGQLARTVGLWSGDVFPDVFSTDPADVIQKFTYEPASAQLLTSSDPRVTSTADPDTAGDAEYERRLTRYTYSPPPAPRALHAVDLPTPTLPDGQPGGPVRIEFPSYDDHGRALETVAPNGLHTVNEYAPDAAGTRAGFLLGRTFDPGGLDLHHGVEPDELGRTVRVSRPSAADAGDGRFTSTARYDARSRIVESVSTPPFSVRIANSYDRTGHLVRSEQEVSDAAGNRTGSLVTENHYDDEGHVVRQRVGGADGVETKQFRMKYDRAGRPMVMLAPTGRIRLLRYDERSLLRLVIEDLGGVDAKTRRIYDADGRLDRVIDPRGAVTRYLHDALGRNTEVVDPLGNRFVRHFDKLGNPLVECFFERRDGDAYVLVHRRELSYDELGQLVTAGMNRFDAVDAVASADVATTFRDSGPGRLLQLQFFRDGVGNIVKEVDQDGREFPVEFDILGRVVARSDPAGNEIRLGYDREGNIIRVDRRELIRDPQSGAVTGKQWFAEAFDVDELNRVIAHHTVTGTAQLELDSRGLATLVTDRAGNRSEHDYDVFGRCVETRQLLEVPGGSPPVVPVRTSYSYNRDDQLVQHVDTLGRVTRFDFDRAGRLRRTVLDDGSTDGYDYDRVGNTTAYVDRNGLRRQITNDALGRVTELVLDVATVPAGSPSSASHRTRLEYDALGRIASAASDFVINRFAYDSLGVLRGTTSFTPASGADPAAEFTIGRELSDTGAVTALTHPSGRRITFARDVLDRVVQVNQAQPGQGNPGDPAAPASHPVASIEYAGLRPARITRGNGSVTTYGYDFNGRPADLVHTVNGTRLLRQQRLYDRIGNVIQQHEDTGGQRTLQQFRYDWLSRLCAVLRGSGGQLPDLSGLAPPASPLPDPVPDRQGEIDALLQPPPAPGSDYTYDETGNRLAAQSSTGAHVYHPNNVDEYADVDGAARTFDGNGNRLADAGFTYAYDYRNQLVALQHKGTGAQTSFLRDAFGRICAERDGTGTRILLHDSHRLLEERDASGLRRSVVCSGQDDQYLLESSGGADGYLLSDLTRSVRAVVDGAAPLATYRYDEFGRLLSPLAPGDDNVFFFAGMRRAGQSESYDCDYRTYDPADGRFLQRDARGFADGSNLYTFARNNPLTRSDPMGAESREEHPPIAAKLGAELAYRNPEGFTLAVPDNYDREKIRTYRERINDPLDRGVGIRSKAPGSRSATEDLRRANKTLRNEFEASLPGGRRPAGTHIDHTVELQHIIREQPGQLAPGADVVRPQDHRVQDARLNSSQGRRGQMLNTKQLREGAPLDTSAGGVASERDVNKLWNREGYRTGMRLFGYYNLVGGTFDAATSVGDDIREGNFSGAALNTSAYLGGAFEAGGIVAKSSSLLSAGRWLGAPAAVVSSGVIGARIGHNLYENYVDKKTVLDAGSWVEEKTGYRVLGATAAAATAIGDAAVHAPEAAYDYVTDNVTLDPDDIDWDRTLKPWKWF